MVTFKMKGTPAASCIHTLARKERAFGIVRGSHRHVVNLPVSTKGEGIVMVHAVEKIAEEIRSLTPAQKAELLRSLIAELDAPADADVEGAWLEETRRRHREMVEGKVKGVPGERVFENLRSRLRR